MSVRNMQIMVNGVSTEASQGLTVQGLLAEQGLQHRRVAVAVNREVVPRAQQSERVLVEGDEVEIVHAVQGG